MGYSVQKEQEDQSYERLMRNNIYRSNSILAEDIRNASNSGRGLNPSPKRRNAIPEVIETSNTTLKDKITFYNKFENLVVLIRLRA